MPRRTMIRKKKQSPQEGFLEKQRIPGPLEELLTVIKNFTDLIIKIQS